MDLGLLLTVAAAIVAHSVGYESQVVTALTFLLAFTTVNISRGSAHSLIASVILACGMAAIALRRCWFEMEIPTRRVLRVGRFLSARGSAPL